MKTNRLLLAFLSVTILSCKKQNANDIQGNCDNIAHATITSNSPVTIGETIKFGTDEVGGYRIYEWRGPDYYTGQEPSDSITDANLENEGWYYLHLYSLDDNSCEKIDSVYVDVKLKQGTPVCSIGNNTCTFNNLADDSYTTVHKRIESTYSLKSLEGSGPGSNIIIYFHPFWVNGEPEDGVYTTTNVPSFGQFDNNYNKVFITTTKSSIYWASHEDQNVYVSHVNGKLQVRFCNLSMGGYNGISYTTIASGNVVEL